MMRAPLGGGGWYIDGRCSSDARGVYKETVQIERVIPQAPLGGNVCCGVIGNHGNWSLGPVREVQSNNKCIIGVGNRSKIQRRNKNPERRGPNKLGGPAGWAVKTGLLTISKRTGDAEMQGVS